MLRWVNAERSVGGQRQANIDEDHRRCGQTLIRIKAGARRASQNRAAPLPVDAMASRDNSDFDADLIRRYGGSVPRYTSYPTALQFDERFGLDDLRAAIARVPPGSPPSIYLHVPFCTSPCFYCACTRVINRQRAMVERYTDRLVDEIRLWGELWDGQGRGVRQLHFGGGTPTELDERQFEQLMSTLERQFGFVTDAEREYSLEIDPRTVDAGRLRALAELGFNRVSFGVQDLDPAVQQAINREQPLALTEAAVEAARAAGIRSVAIDLIYGLPRQTPASFERTLAQVAALQPDRIAVYAYAHMPQMFPAQRQIRRDELPDAGTRLDLLRAAVEIFTAAGYRRIGMDHFARPGDDLARALEQGGLHRNFQGYSTHAGAELIGIGMSAISRIADCYAQNAKRLDDYLQCVDAGLLPVARGLRLDAEDLLRRDVIDRIMCAGEVDGAVLGARHGVAFWAHFHDARDALRELADDGLVRVDGERLLVTPRGRPLVRNIARVFDRYAPATPPARHSAAI